MAFNTQESQEEQMESNLILQKEEIEALSAIYGDDFSLDQDSLVDWENRDGDGATKQDARVRDRAMPPTFSIIIKADVSTEESENEKDCAAGSTRCQDSEARLIVSFQDGYPTTCPPTYQLFIPWLRGGHKQIIADALEEIYLQHLGESIIYLWVEKVRELLPKKLDSERMSSDASAETDSEWNRMKVDQCGKSCAAAAPAATDFTSPKELIDHFSNTLSLHDSNSWLGTSNDDDNVILQQAHPSKQQDLSPTIEIQTGAPLTDRKSTFQAHVAPVSKPTDVRVVLEELYKNKKIASATHNMYAYRIFKTDSNTWLQDCNDDGETHAGGRLLHLLQILDVKNVLVVVSRWYGGIQLHGDRFKHINNVARQALDEFGFLPSTDAGKTETPKAKRVGAKR